jgi:predicted ester cyclase
MSKNLKIRAAALKKAFPDYTLQYGDFVYDGNKVVATITLSGTQKGPFLGIAPTNKPIHLKFVDIFTIENGKIVEISQMWNELSVMKQIGYIVF